MTWPSLLDSDPNVARLSLECVLRVTSSAGNITNPMLPVISAAVLARSGVAPLSVVLEGGGSAAALVTMPGDRQLWDWIGLVMSAMAAANRPGAVTGWEQGRIT